MLDGILNFVGDVEIFIAGAGAIVFAVSYGVFFNWRSTGAGRSLMYFVMSLIALSLINALGRWVGHDYPLREWLRLAVYTGIVVTVWRLVIVLWRTWRRTESMNIEQKEKHHDHLNP